MAPRQPLEALLDALVDVEEPKLQVEDRLAGDAEPEVPGLDDARVDRPHREMEDALAGHGPIGAELPSHARHGLAVSEPTPNEVKLAVCGNGAADKQQVAVMVGRLLGMELSGASDDATDALAVAIGALYPGSTA